MNEDRDPSLPAAGSGWGLVESGAASGRPERGPRYTSLGRVGRGGMGQVEVVWDAWLRREVARKTPVPDVPSDLGKALIRHEAVMTARLDHPNVVPLLDTGETVDGLPWLTLPYLQGSTLHDRMAAGERRRVLLRAVLSAARGIAHAHGRGVVHADIKPSNLVVQEDGEAQVLDWGLARSLDPGADEGPVGPKAGTPAYQAPEIRAGGRPTPQSDVFALGVVVREVLEASAGHGDDREPRDLLALVGRACDPSVAARYPHAGAFAADLRRWLDGAPVLAHDYDAVELLRLQAWRWRRPLGLGAAVAMAAFALLGMANVRLQQERDRALDAERRHAATAAGLFAERAEAASRRGDGPRARTDAQRALEFGAHPLAEGVLASIAPPAAERLGASTPLDCDGVLHVDGDGILCVRGDRLVRVDPTGANLWSLPVRATKAFPLSAAEVAVVSEAGLARWRIDGEGPVTVHASVRDPIWVSDTWFTDHVALRRLDAGGASTEMCGPASSIDSAWDAPDQRVWTVCAKQGVVRRDPDGMVVALPGDAGTLGHVTALAGVGDELLAGTLDGSLARISRTSGDVVRLVDTPLGVIRQVAPGPARGSVLVTDALGALVLWRPDDGVVSPRLVSGGVRGVRWTGPETFDVVTDAVSSWRLRPDAAAGQWWERAGVSTLAVDPTQTRVAVGVGPTLVLRDWPTGAVRQQLPLHTRIIKDVDFSPSGARIGTGAADRDVGVAVVDPLGEVTPLSTTWPMVRDVTWLGEHRLLAAPWSRMARVWEGASGTWRSVPLGRAWVSVERNPFGVIVLDEDGGVARLDDDLVTTPLFEVAGARALAVARDSPRIALLVGGRLEVRTVPDGEVVARLPAPAATTLSLAHDGGQVLWGTMAGEVHSWEVDAGVERWHARVHDGQVSAAVALEDGWVTAGWDGRVQHWRASR